MSEFIGTKNKHTREAIKMVTKTITIANLCFVKKAENFSIANSSLCLFVFYSVVKITILKFMPKQV